MKDNTKQQHTVGIERFCGVYAKAHQTPSITDGMAQTMRNFRITEDGFLRRREGYQKLCDLPSDLRGFCCGKDPATWEESVFYCVGKSIYRIRFREGTATLLATFPALTEQGEVTVILFCNRLYVLDGVDLYYWDEESHGRVPGYIPLCHIDVSPTGGAGTAREVHNALTRYARASYTFTEGCRVFLLPEPAMRILSVSVNGQEVAFTEESGFADPARIQFVLETSIPPSKNCVVVCYELPPSSRRAEILQNKQVFLFGGSDDLRVFLYGSYSGNVEYSVSMSDFARAIEYFPEDGRISISSGPIMGIVRRYNHLLIHTLHETYAVQDNGNGYRFFLVHDRIGTQKIGYAQAIEEDSVTVSGNQIYRIKTTTLEGDRSVICISDRISDLLKSGDLQSGICYVHVPQKELWFATPSAIWVYRYDRDVWYTFDNPGVRAFFPYCENQVGFRCGDSLYAYTAGCDTDCTLPIRAIWQSAPFAMAAVRTPLAELGMKVWDADGVGAVTVRIASYDDAIGIRKEAVMPFAATAQGTVPALCRRRLSLHTGAAYALRIETQNDVTVAFCGLRTPNGQWEVM